MAAVQLDQSNPVRTENPIAHIEPSLPASFEHEHEHRCAEHEHDPRCQPFNLIKTQWFETRIPSLKSNQALPRHSSTSTDAARSKENDGSEFTIVTSSSESPFSCSAKRCSAQLCSCSAKRCSNCGSRKPRSSLDQSNPVRTENPIV